MVRSASGFAAHRKAQRKMRAGAKASKAKKAAHAKSSTGRMAKDLATIKGDRGKGSMSAREKKNAMASVRRRQAKKANYQHEG